MARSDAFGSGPATPGPQLAPGSELAGYRIESLLGRGGMGVVYRAHDLALDRHVALKLLAPELAEDVRFRERFHLQDPRRRPPAPQPHHRAV